MKRLLAVALLSFAAVAGGGSPAVLTVHQWEASSDGEALSGRVLDPEVGEMAHPVAGISVVLTDVSGRRWEATGPTDEEGRFQIAGVSSGVYGLIARGERHFACSALHVVESEHQKDSVPVDITLASISPEDVSAKAARYAATGLQLPVEFERETAKRMLPVVDQSRVYRVIRSNGGMTGTLYRAGFVGQELVAAKPTNVLVFGQGGRILKTLSADDGRFEIPMLPAGVYSLLAAGEEGIGITSFELVDPNSAQLSADENVNGDMQFVSATNVADTCCPSFSMQLAPACCGTIGGAGTTPAAPVDGIPVDAGFVGDPMAGGYGGGFGGGGGGFGGGGGGLAGGGGLRGVALLGGTAAALAIGLSDDDDIVVPPPPASPATP